MDKGVAMVFMDKPDYINKALTLLDDTNTYRFLNKDPTTKIKNMLLQTPKDIKQSGGLSDQKYKKLYLTGVVHLSFMAFLNSTNLAPPQAYSVQ